MDPANLPVPPLAIAGIRLNVADVGRASAFYAALGFTVATPGRLTFGRVVLELVAATGAPYPAPRFANDPWFQHFAIAVADIEKGAAIALAAGATPISHGGPQRLPPNTGSVTAWKFRDPDGHPVELSLIPDSAWLNDAPRGAVFLGVDHTAITVCDLAVSQAWYEALSFREKGRSRNRGPEQDRLDGLDGVVVDIVALGTICPGPHLELLCYRAPPAAQPKPVDDRDVTATYTLITHAVPTSDPDGHRLALGSLYA
ncbi:MAG: VOC family protein [Bradyrhizobium sp.]